AKQHASGAFTHQRVEVDLERIPLGLFRSNYSYHAAYLSMDGLAARPPGFNNQEGTPRSSPRPGSITSGYILTSSYAGLLGISERSMCEADQAYPFRSSPVIHSRQEQLPCTRRELNSRRGTDAMYMRVARFV